MMFLAQAGPRIWSPEGTVGFLAILGLASVAVWAFVRWLLAGPAGPEPWDAETAAAVAEAGATPLCHRCLSPNDPEADFCAECGATIGQYTNYLPYPYVFSLGHTLRIGAAGEFKRSFLTILGFVLLPLAEPLFLAPFFWFVFVRNLTRPNQPEATAEPNPPA